MRQGAGGWDPGVAGGGMLAGRLEGIRFESVGELELKGFPEPIEAFAVPWRALADERAGSAAGRCRRCCDRCRRAAFVGRDGRTSADGALAQSGAAGARQVVLVSGEPGIGKSRLASFTRAWRARRGVCGLLGGVLGGAGGAVRAMDPVLLAAGRARTCGRARAARRASRRRARAAGARSAATGARGAGAAELRSGDRALPALLGGRRRARRVGGVAARVPRARRPALGGRPVGGAAQARGVGRRGLRAPGDRRLSATRIWPRTIRWPGCSRTCGGSRVSSGSRCRGSARPRCPSDGGRGRARAGCRRAGARGGDRDRDRRQPVLRRRDAAQPGRVRRDCMYDETASAGASIARRRWACRRACARCRPPGRAARRARAARGVDARGRDRPLVRRSSCSRGWSR